MSEMIEQFRAITGDSAVSDHDIRKYLGWGKGNLQMALNYYYRKKDKETRSVDSFPSQAENNTGAFTKMKNASIRQNRTESFIKQVREEYQLPIKRGVRTRSVPGDRNSKQIMEDQEEQAVDAEFADADYLPQVFGLKGKEGETSLQMARMYSQNKKQQDADQTDKKLEEIQGDSMEVSKVLNQSLLVNQVLQQQGQNTKSLGLKARRQSKEKVHMSKDERNSLHFGWVSGESEIYLGETILSGFAIKFQNNVSLPPGSHIQFRYFIEQEKKKKSFKSKNADKVTNIRLLNRASEFGRLKQQQSRILVPLLVHGIIRIQLYALTIPNRIDYYTSLKITARIYLLKKAISQPVVQTFEGHSDLIVSIYKPVAEEILAIFQRVQVKIKRWPLIKRSSRWRHKLASQGVASAKLEAAEDGTEREKELERQKRMRNDPFFKSVQVNLSTMLRAGLKEENSNSQQPQKEPQSAVKKKTLQYKTLDEDRCAQLIDLYEQDLQPHQPSQNFVSTLYHYQALALAWMIRRQCADLKPSAQQLHPLWTQYEIGDSRSLFLNQLTSQISLKPPYARSKCLGGILADEMGLGKTVMMAALFATSSSGGKRKKREGRNLVVVPLTLLSQWQAEIERHTRGLRTLIYYAQDRRKYESELQKFDVVITTYGTVSHEFTRGCHIARSGLYRVAWQRIILDEAHYIKGRVIQTAKAVYELEASFRWCLTGTPIQNGLADLFSLLHFIRYTPWSEWECWNKYILKPSESGEEDVFEVLRNILKRVFLRRTKQSKDHQGKCIVDLPPRSSKVELLQMNAKEREFYDSVYESSRLKIQQLQKMGILTTKYMQVFEILIRLRQICCHPMLFKSVHKFTSDLGQFETELRRFVAKRQSDEQGEQRYFQPVMEGEEEQRVEVAGGKGMSEAFLKQTLAKISDRQLQNCVICLSEIQDPVITPCLHIFCRVCAVRQIEECAICSACRRRLTREDILSLPRENRFNQSLDDGFFPSTKLIALVEHLRKLTPGDKAVVFSQFLGMLDLIEHQLKAEKLVYLRMQGNTTHKERTRIVDTFQRDPSVQVLVVSLKTAGVGLNLVAANRVFLVDPWWNPGVQEQAIERVHRIGQTRSVQIIRLVMDRSIETRMLELNSGKKQLSQRVLAHDGSGSESKVQKLRYLMAKY